MRQSELIKEKWQALDDRSRRRLGISIIVVLAAAVLISYGNGAIGQLKKKRQTREEDLASMLVLRQRLMAGKAGAQIFANRLASTRADESPARIVEEIGIKGKSVRITPLKSDTDGPYLMDSAEVRMEGISANDAVNLLYKLEKGSRPVIVRRALLKTRFDDPSRLDVLLNIALLKATVTSK